MDADAPWTLGSVGLWGPLVSAQQQAAVSIPPDQMLGQSREHDFEGYEEDDLQESVRRCVGFRL